MKLFNALPTKNGLMIGAIKVHNSIWMNFAKLLGHRFLFILIKLKITVSKLIIFLNNFVQNVDVKWKSFSTIQLLDQLSANWASDTILIVQF